MPATPQFSIITPSLNHGDWLKLCIASVADQTGVTLEHLVQDAGSTDGTTQWLQNDPRVIARVEADAGMYDAINRGLHRARGEFVAYLNCDEQYLPGALQRTQAFFAQHPDVDILFGDVLVLDPGGHYRYHRKQLPPTLSHTWVCHLSPFSCAIFIRRQFIERHHLLFDSRLRYVGDAEWMVRALLVKPRMARLDAFVSAFTETGENLSTTEDLFRELIAFWQTAPHWVQTLRPFWTFLHRVRRALSGVYFQRPFSYSVYTRRKPDRRETFHAEKPTGRWQPQAAVTERAKSERP